MKLFNAVCIPLCMLICASAVGQVIEIKGIRPGMTYEQFAGKYKWIYCEPQVDESKICRFHIVEGINNLPELTTVAEQKVSLWTFYFSKDDILSAALITLS